MKWLLIVVLFILAVLLFCYVDWYVEYRPIPTSNTLVTYPLDPLTSNEISIVRATVVTQAGLSSNTTFWAQLHEPPKSEVLGESSESAYWVVHRQADVVAICPDRQGSFEYLIDITGRRILTTNSLGNLQPAISGAEFTIANDVVDNSPEVRAALGKRHYQIKGKISDQFYLDLYAPGHDPALEKDGKTIRAIRVLFADRQGGTNSYGAYVEGLMALVDVFGKKVLAVQDHPGAIATNSVPHDIFNRAILGPQNPRADLHITPSASSRLKLAGHHVRWENWDFRYGFNQREGLVLYEIGWHESNTLRSICYRASVSEMLVPYADPSPAWQWREFFDSGEYGLGYVSTEANAGKELPENALTLPVILPDDNLQVANGYQNRVFLYERDGGALFAHTQSEHQARIYARARDLVVGFVATIGNYDYIYQWVFREDGSFGFEAQLEGIVLNKTIADTNCQLCAAESASGPGVYLATNNQQFGSVVSPQMDAVFHQHWFNLRLDFDIDATNNAVEERDTLALPADPAANPASRAFTVRRGVFGHEREAERDCNAASNRTWVVYNPNVKSALGHFPGFEVAPEGNAPSSISASRLGDETSFTQHHLWVTKLHPNEIYAAGNYPNQAPAHYHDTLFDYANNNEDIYNQDVVLWYSLGFTHITRPEDYPIMPSAHIAVNFLPCGFFARSPALGYATVEAQTEK